jgi:hypothetical protein
MAWKKKLSKLMAMLALEKGYSLNAGEARMVLLATLRLLEERDLAYNPEIGLVQGVDKVFGDIAQSFGTAKYTVRLLFQSFYDSDGESYHITDSTFRGKGSPAYDRAVVRSLTLFQCRAIETFMEHRNSSKGPGKVTLDEMAKYMEEGPIEGSGDPPLIPDLRVSIPRSSLRYALIHYLGYKHGYTKKKTTFSSPAARHLCIRKFIIEMDRALKLQDATYVAGKFVVRGEYVIVFTDETYIHQNHSPLTSWTKDGFVGKTSTKGKRLVVLNAITMDDFLVTRGVGGEPISTEDIKKGAPKVKLPTAEWIWPAHSNHEDYHKNMDGAGFEWWVENRLIPAFEKLYPGKKMVLVMDNASYHHEHNTEFYPAGKTPANATKGLNARVGKQRGLHGD